MGAGMGALQQCFGPSAERRVGPGDRGQRRSRAVDQQLAKISVASLADAKKLRSAAGGELRWDQTQPRRQVATVLESLALADRRDQRRGDCRADARGMDANRRASSFSFVQRMNSVSKAAIR